MSRSTIHLSMNTLTKNVLISTFECLNAMKYKIFWLNRVELFMNKFDFVAKLFLSFTFRVR